MEMETATLSMETIACYLTIIPETIRLAHLAAPANWGFEMHRIFLRLGPIFITLIACYCFGRESVTLEKVLALYGVDETVVKMVSNSKIMARSEEPEHQAVHVFGLDGGLEMTLSVRLREDETFRGFVDFGYSPWDHRYVVSVELINEEEKQRYYELQIFDGEDGEFLGNGYVYHDGAWVSRKGVEKGALVDQIVSDRNSLFFNYWGIDPDYDQALLTEVKMRPYLDGFSFEKEGESFSPRVGESLIFKSDFCRRYLVAESDRLLVLDQMQPRIWLFGADPMRRKKDASYKAINLKYRVLPFESPDSDLPSFKYKPTQDDFLTWFYSFSRVEGFKRMGGHNYVVAYTAPNESHPAYRDGKLQKSNNEFGNFDTPALFKLHLTSLFNDLTPTGKTISLEGFHFLGADSEKIYVWRDVASSAAGDDKKRSFTIEVTAISSERLIKKPNPLAPLKAFFSSEN